MSTTAVAITPRTLELELSSDRKVSPLSRWAKGKERWEPRVLNTLGLPALESCPGRTEACSAACYAARIPWPSVHKLLARNLAALERADTEHGMTELLDSAVAAYLRTREKWDPDGPNVFRIHWSGDFYRREYVAAWRRVILANPDVRFWAYTRTLTPWCLDPLSGLPNLALYLSSDVNNVDAVATASAIYGLPIAHMSHDKPRVHPMERGYYITCPVDAGNRPMVSDDGIGGCVACRLCIDGERDIFFPER